MSDVSLIDGLTGIAGEAALETKFGPPGIAVENVEKRVKQYVAVRDAIKVVKERHTTELEKLEGIKDELTGLLQSALDAVGAESIKTPEGTVYTTIKYTATLTDPKAFMDFVISNKKFDLLDRKANSPAVRDYVNENGGLPPGANLSSIATVGVRRPTK